MKKNTRQEKKEHLDSLRGFVKRIDEDLVQSKSQSLNGTKNISFYRP